MKTFFFLALLLAAVRPACAVSIEWVTVGDPGNAADTTGFGAVSYTYQIGKYEVTNAQYCEFLNAVSYELVQAYALYSNDMGLNSTRGGIAIVIANPPGSRFVVRPNMADKPVNNVSWLSAARFANWLQNGQGNASTETGTYELNDSMIYGLFPRASGKIGLPTNNEWYKAAYYQGGGYTLHATGSNDFSPVIAACGSTGVISNPGINVVNYGYGCDWNGQNGHVTSVGSAGPSSASHYGTFDQAGNVAEFTDTTTHAAGFHRILRGGGFDATNFTVRSTVYSNYNTHTVGAYNIGFRLARPAPAPPPSNIDSNSSYVWSGNAGWIKLVHDRPTTGDGVLVTDSYLKGLAWSDSTGWLNFGDGTPADGLRYSNTDGSDFGVNQDGGGNLSGLAWSANLGWINFGWAAPDDDYRPRIDLVTGHFIGYAWSSSIGWITLGTGKAKAKNFFKPDSDFDGLADSWEKQHSGSLNSLSAAMDSDSDGFTNLQEYLAGTNPMDPASRLNLNDPIIFPDDENPGTVTTLLSWPDQASRLYRLQVSSDLVTWQDSPYGLIYPSGMGQNYRALMHTGAGLMFYRVQAVLPFEP